MENVVETVLIKGNSRNRKLRRNYNDKNRIIIMK
jgi:hypothetical protein